MGITMAQSAISTLRHRTLMAIRETGRYMTADELAGKLRINRPRFAEALREAGVPFISF